MIYRYLSLLPFLVLLVPAQCLYAAEPSRLPNIIFILADDLGYGDIGCFGQTKIKTPHLDQLAKEGMRFTQAYAGSTVCAPSRCALMTGLHTGHCRTRGNGGHPKGNVPLEPDDLCVAEVLKKAGYRTALVGKWGLGEEGSTGIPTKKGFDFFYGYLNQVHAHNYYPDFLWRNETKEKIDNPQSKDAGVAEKCNVYAPDLLLKEAIQFISDNREKPFFLYFSTIVPHANNEKTKVTGNGNEVPSDEPYTKENWPQAEKDRAALITRMDADIGKLLAHLKELKLDQKTLVIFSSDNGPHQEGGNKAGFFNSSGPFRGVKRALTDGGIRVPTIARWPEVIKPNTTSDHVWAFWDILPTVCEISGQEIPKGIDGISFLPTLMGKGEQKKHEFLYWEFHEGGSKQAVRYGDFKAIRLSPSAPLELYDLSKDISESKNIASEHPKVIEKIEAYLKTARTESKEFPLVEPKVKKK